MVTGCPWRSTSPHAICSTSVLKIDRSFVLNMLTNAADAMIVRSTIDLGHNLGLQVVGEGVESQEIHDALRELGCDIGQGFHIGRPMARAEFERWMTWRSVAA